MNLKIEEEIQGLNQKNCKHVAWGTVSYKKKTKNKKKQTGNIYKSKLIIVITVKIID